MRNNKRLIYITIGLAAVIFIAYVLILGLQSRDKTATLDIQSAVPDDINVTIDGQKVNSTQKVGVKPGDHTVAAKRKGFESKTEKVNVKAFETKTIRFLLKPNGPEGTEWATNHPDAFREYEALSGKEFTQDSANLTKKYPIMPYLPNLHPRWRIDYGASQKNPNDLNAIALYITYVEESDKQDALDWVKSKGFNINDYEVIYKQPQDPNAAGG